jgi:hypothetical protein
MTDATFQTVWQMLRGVSSKQQYHIAVKNVAQNYMTPAAAGNSDLPAGPQDSKTSCTIMRVCEKL